jgi:hypothetical protein
MTAPNNTQGNNAIVVKWPDMYLVIDFNIDNPIQYPEINPDLTIEETIKIGGVLCTFLQNSITHTHFSTNGILGNYRE